MPLNLLRQLVYEGALSGLISDPPWMLQSEDKITGLHLLFDGWFLQRVTAQVFEGGLRIGSQQPTVTNLIPSEARREERRRACGYALGTFGLGSDPAFEALLGWPSRCVEMGYPERAKPVIILYDYDTSFDTNWLADAPREYNGFPIRYRASQPALAQVGIGDKIGTLPPEYGTLGGYLFDSSSNRNLAITCGHVVGDKGQAVNHIDNNSSLVPFGTILDSTIPSVVAPCNRRAASNPGVDAALIQINEERSVPPSCLPTLPQPGTTTLAHIDSIDQDDIVVFHGATSGLRKARVTSATIWKKVDVRGSTFCYGDMFSIGHRDVAYILQSVSNGGDSGSWILEDSSLAASKWYGMLIAGDRQHNQSLACYAEHVLDWSKSVNSDIVIL